MQFIGEPRPCSRASLGLAIEDNVTFNSITINDADLGNVMVKLLAPAPNSLYGWDSATVPIDVVAGAGITILDGVISADVSAVLAGLVALTSHAALRAIVTLGAGLPVNALRFVSVGRAAEIWLRVTGTDADDDVSFIRADDYAEPDNAGGWARIL